MGEFDHVRSALDALGALDWMQISIKPAKPFALGGVARPGGIGVTVLGLPGNPVSSMVAFELLARPAIALMGGAERLPMRNLEVGRAAEPFARRPDGKIHFVRVVAEPASDGIPLLRSAGGQGSHQLSAMAAADALAVLPDGAGAEMGDLVTMLRLRG
ncbi:MAG: hypothetical protein R2698_02585 [Microthrixaceae bacterium]